VSNKQLKQGSLEENRLAKNVILFGITSLSDIFLLLLLILSGRYLGVEDFGVFSLALSLSTLLVFSTDLGLDSLVIRRIAIQKNDAPYIINAISGWKLIITLIALFVYLGFIFFFLVDGPIRNTAIILGCAAIFRSINMTLRAYFHAFENFLLESRVILLERILLFSIGSLVVIFFPDPLTLAIIFLGSRLIATVTYIYLINKHICKISPRIDFEFSKRFQIEAIPLGISALIFGVSMQVDTLILGVFRDVAEVGVFSATLKIYEGLLVVPLVINAVIYPRLAYLQLSMKDEFSKLFSRAYKYIMILSMLVIMAGLLFHNEIMLILFGKKYMGGVDVLLLMVVAVGIQFQVSLLFTAMKAIGKLKEFMCFMLFGLLIRFMGDVLLIPYYGMYGAGISILVSVILTLIGVLYYSLKIGIDLHSISKKILLVVLSFLITIFVYIFVSHQKNIIFEIGLVLVSYVVCLIIFRVFDSKEFILLRSLFCMVIRRVRSSKAC